MIPDFEHLQYNKPTDGKVFRVFVENIGAGRQRREQEVKLEGWDDHETAEGIMDFRGELNGEGRTIVMVMHDLRLVKRAKRALRLVNGAIQPDGHSLYLPAETPAVAAAKLSQTIDS
jgi:hypothetical protein